MILYCDTSALIIRYVEEDGTGSVDRLWDSALAIVTSTVAFAEAVSAFSRKLREGILTHKEYLVTVKNFKKDYNHLILVPINNDLNLINKDENQIINNPIDNDLNLINKDENQIINNSIDNDINKEGAAKKHPARHKFNGERQTEN